MCSAWSDEDVHCRTCCDITPKRKLTVLATLVPQQPDTPCLLHGMCLWYAGKLTEIAPSAPQKPVSGGGAAPPSKQTNVGKVLNLNSKDESSCSIQ